MRTPGRIPELDGIRGIAILLVLVGHSVGVRPWRDMGDLGVELFFVLSGYLITGILLDSRGGQNYFRNFYARRALRILPLYFVTIAIVALTYAHTLRFVLLSTFYLANMAPLLGVPMVYGVLWSLAVEEHFYAVWPAVTHKLGPRGVAFLSAGILLLEPIVRLIGYRERALLYYASWFRFDQLAAGASLACLLRITRFRIYDIGLGAVALSGVLAAFVSGPAATSALQFTVVALMAVALICLSLSLSTVGKLMRWAPLMLCGEWSYCLYLTHLLIFRAMSVSHGVFAEPTGSVSRRLAAVALCFLVAEVSRRYFERPILLLKRRFQAPHLPICDAEGSLDRALRRFQTATEGNGQAMARCRND